MTKRREETEAQFRELIKEYNSTIAHLCRAYYPLDDYLYKDLYGIVLFRLWRKIHLYRYDDNLSAWVYRVTVNTCRSHYRHHVHRAKIVLFSSLPESYQVSQEEGSEDEENRRKMYRMIDLLDPGEREILSFHLDGMTNVKIAECLGITQTNVSTRINRIKNKLIKMHQDGKDEPGNELFE